MPRITLNFLLKRVRNLTQIAALLSILGLTLGYLGNYFWVFELFSHFRVQYIVALLISAVVLFFFGERKLSVLSALIGGVFAIFLYPYFLPMPVAAKLKEEPDAKIYKILSFNVLRINRQFDKVRNFIKTENADFVLLMEIDQRWLMNMKPLEKIYPHRVYKARQDSFGIIFFSKHKILRHEIKFFSQNMLPSIIAKIFLKSSNNDKKNKEKVLNFIGTHPMSPTNRMNALRRNEQINALREFILENNPTNFILAGDMNITPWSPIMKRFFRDTKLRDSRYGHGIIPTWNRKVPLMAIPIDYVLGNGGIIFASKKIGDNFESDHNPIIAEFALANP